LWQTLLSILGNHLWMHFFSFHFFKHQKTLYYMLLFLSENFQCSTELCVHLAQRDWNWNNLAAVLQSQKENISVFHLTLNPLDNMTLQFTQWKGVE
jgi:hypothetical protein